MQKSFLALEIGGTKLQLVRGDESATIVERRRCTVKRQEGAEGIRRQIRQTLAEMLRDHPADAVGVGFGGPVDWRTGTIARSHQIEGWADFQLGSWLESLVKASVRVDNDANVAALGEALSGAGVGSNPVFYVTLGSGVGGGLVVNGQIYHGAPPGEAEIGHVRLDRKGTALESRCSGWAVDEKIRQLKARDPKSLLATLARGPAGGEARHLVVALEKKDPAAQRILDETAADLAFGLSHAVHLFHPEVILLGGGLSLVGEPLRAAVAHALPAMMMEAFRPGPQIRLAALGEDAVPVGALHLARTAD